MAKSKKKSVKKSGKKSVKQKRTNCQAKGKVYNAKTQRCRTSKKKTKKQPKLSFYDVGAKTKVMLDTYTVKTKTTNGKNGKRKITYALGHNPKTGNNVARIISNTK